MSGPAAHPPAGGHGHSSKESWGGVMWSVIVGLFVLGGIIYPMVEGAIQVMKHPAGALVTMVLLIAIPLIVYLLVTGKISIPSGGGDGHGHGPGA